MSRKSWLGWGCCRWSCVFWGMERLNSRNRWVDAFVPLQFEQAQLFFFIMDTGYLSSYVFSSDYPLPSSSQIRRFWFTWFQTSIFSWFPRAGKSSRGHEWIVLPATTTCRWSCSKDRIVALCGFSKSQRVHFFLGISFLEDMTMTQNKCTTPLAMRTPCLRVQRINPAGRYEDGLDRNFCDTYHMNSYDVCNT